MTRLIEALQTSLSKLATPIVYDHGQWMGTELLLEDVRETVRKLKKTGVVRGSRVVIALPNSYEFVVNYLALLLSGSVAVPMNPELPVSEAQQVVARVQPALVISRTGVWEQALARGHFVHCETDPKAPEIRWCIPLDVQEVHAKLPIQEESPAILMYTSGTTGQPKGVLLTHGHLWAAVNNVIDSHQLTAMDTAYCFLPLFHINAQVIVLLSTLVSGGKLVMQERFSARSFWSNIRRHKVTWVSAVPTILSIVVKGASEKPLPTRFGTYPPAKSLRFIRTASAPLSPVLAAQFEQRFGVPVIESYGMTEAAGQICINPLPPRTRKTGFVGLPCGVQLRILDDDYQELPNGVTGQIAIRGKNVISHYVDVSNKSAGFHNDWLLTGDLGEFDDDGYLKITGRKKELINRAGEKISPREVEDVLNGHPRVQLAAVVGEPDAIYGEIVVAYVVPQEDRGHNGDWLVKELMAYCEKHLAKPKRPAQIRVIQELPVGATGKVQKHRLQHIGR
ncbi:AMP-binding protein [Alicyclobacillus tolerans]|uniref:AMP-binding protein n=1 Tax=Alicyclobacillus tolerans TaxID=90970 RepID=UPI001F2E7CF1|nr:AMP-binding protein [Alicyclobacillus tolerans]MCF8565910.1 AMP-binding protein [Alicyclobacillus tolerans]